MNLKHIIAILSLLLAAYTGTVSAATISYNLDMSNAIPDGVDYLTVTISDSLTTAGDIDFSVEVNTSNYPNPGSNFGMDNFYFNFDDSLNVKANNITDLNPDSWKINTNKNAGGDFSFFKLNLKGTGNSRTDLLTFTISDIVGDSIQDYAVGYEGVGEALFAAHVGGFDNGAGIESAKFGAVVPVPGAVWLFGSGLLVLAGLIRRRT
jgi:hypothetical protein